MRRRGHKLLVTKGIATGGEDLLAKSRSFELIGDRMFSLEVGRGCLIMLVQF